MEYGLAQNYPNPFNPETLIRYDVPQPAKLKLVVYDILGLHRERCKRPQKTESKREALRLLLGSASPLF